ncbi:hypothetical protein V2J09_017434 [Rumex salicifolius]
MGRTPCCDKVGLKKGPWTPEEDLKLLAYVEENGHGNWRALPSKAGLQRCGKSCRLRWTNYLRPDIKRGKFSLQEEQTIIQLHALLGNRWSAIATHLPKRTDNEIKNYWNTHLKKRLTKMGIDPVTHKPKNVALVSNDGQSKSVANLSHMAQWESARLEAEARLARQSKIRANSLQVVAMDHNTPTSSSSTTTTRCLDVFRAWESGTPWPNTSSDGNPGTHHSPTSTVSENGGGPGSTATATTTAIAGHGGTMIEFMGNNSDPEDQGLVKDEGKCEDEEWKGFGDDHKSHLANDVHNHDHNHDHGHDEYDDEMGISMPPSFSQPMGSFIEGFTELLLCNFSDKNLSSEDTGNEDGTGGGGGGGGESCGAEDNKSYWNCILNLVNSSPSSSPLF